MLSLRSQNLKNSYQRYIPQEGTRRKRIDSEILKLGQRAGLGHKDEKTQVRHFQQADKLSKLDL